MGIEHQAKQWFDGKISTLIPVPVQDSDEKPVVNVKASYANFVWGIPPEHDSLYPSLGFSTTESGGVRKIIAVEKDSVAGRSGFQVGDQVLALDGVATPDRETWNRLMAARNWGDTVVVTVKRGEAELKINAELRRVVKEKESAARPPEAAFASSACFAKAASPPRHPFVGPSILESIGYDFGPLLASYIARTQRRGVQAQGGIHARRGTDSYRIRRIHRVRQRDNKRRRSIPKRAGGAPESPFNEEEEEMELAAELLGVQSEEQLNEFLGKLFKKAVGAVKRFAKSPVGGSLFKILKGAAKTALPMLGTAAPGAALGGPLGAHLGGTVAGAAGKAFGLELEGLSPEDQEFEVARRYVRFAGSASQAATEAAATAPPWWPPPVVLSPRLAAMPPG